MEAPMVSIVLPTYNRAERVKSCVRSVTDQTFRDWELIICDDASTDRTAEVAEQLVEVDERIVYRRNTATQGLPANRNIGISHAKGELLLFIEDDVLLEPDCLDSLVRSYEELSKGHRVGAVAPSCPNEWLPSDDIEKSLLDHAWRGINSELIVPCAVSAWTGLVRHNFAPHFDGVQEVPSVHACSLYPRMVLQEVGGYDSTRYTGNYLYEETDLNIRLSKQGYKFYFQPAARMHHRLARGGGCRVDTLRYAYYFCINHIRYVFKNFGLRSVWMVPAFFANTGIVACRALGAYGLSTLSAKLPKV